MLKLILNIILVGLLSTSSLLIAQDLTELMKAGNEHYQNKEYSEAIDSYESILKQGYFSSDLFYNLGNAYFRKGVLGIAILYYEKALKIAPNNEDASYNLRLARARTVDKIQEIPPIFIFKWWEVLLTSFTSTGWQTIIFIFYVLLIVCIGLYFLSRNLQVQKYAFIFGVMNIAVLTLAVILFFSSLSREASNNEGVLLKSVETAKISPDSQSNDAFVIHEGIKFIIEDKVDNWIKIKLADGKVGWIPSDSFDVI